MSFRAGDLLAPALLAQSYRCDAPKKCVAPRPLPRNAALLTSLPNPYYSETEFNAKSMPGVSLGSIDCHFCG